MTSETKSGYFRAVAGSVMMNDDGTSRLGWHTLRRYFVSIASTCMSLASVLESAGHDSLAMWRLDRETDQEAVIDDFKRFDEKMSHEDPRKADEEDGEARATDYCLANCKFNLDVIIPAVSE